MSQHTRFRYPSHAHMPHLTLFRPKEFTIKLYTIQSGWSIEYIEGSMAIFPKKYCISLKTYFTLANSVDPGNSSGFSLFAKVPVKVFRRVRNFLK